MPKKSSSEEYPLNEITKVKLSEIDPKSTINVRRTGIEESVEAVKSSIAERGYLPEFPIVLRPHPDPQSEFAYENVTGQCRAKAALDLNFEEIPAIIADLDDNTALKRSLSENDKRTPLSPSDYTYWIEKKHEEFKKQGCTPEEAFKKTAAFWNISVAKAKRYHCFGSLPENLKKKVAQRSFPEDAAGVIVKSVASIADEEKAKKIMEERAEWFGKQEKKNRKIAKQAMQECGSDADIGDLEEKKEELTTDAENTINIIIPAKVKPRLVQWGTERGLNDLSSIVVNMIVETLKK